MKKIIGIILALTLVLSFSLVATTPVAAAPPVTNGLVLHLDASDAGSITKDGANRVSQWADLSGNSNDAAQATLANQPLWVDNVLATKSIIRFDGTDDNMRVGYTADVAALTVLVVTRVNSWSGSSLDPSNRLFIATFARAGQAWHTSQIRVRNGDWEGRTWDGSDKPVTGSGVVDEEWKLLSLTAENNGVLKFWEEGISQGSTAIGTILTGHNTISMGSTGQPAGFLNGDIAEILIYDRALSDGERQGVEQYLGRKWLGWATACIATATSSGTACITTSHGVMADLVARAAPSLPSVSFPHGMFSFKITGLSTGQTVTLTVELPDPVPVGTVWWKHDNGRWYSLPNLNDNGNNIMQIKLTDGGAGDSDGLKDGVITDPGGPGNPMTVGWETSPVGKASVVIPWIALLAAIAAGLSLLIWRRHRAQI